MAAVRDAQLRAHVNRFDLVSPDGQPVRWAMNYLHRTGLKERVYGPELMLRLCARAAAEGVSIYLYGSTPEVLGALQRNLSARFPQLQFAGAESPPFRSEWREPDAEAARRINASGAGLVFIGLSCPKQDWFAAVHRSDIQAVQVCVGAAFDFLAGTKRMAPAWMQRRGLEWVFRLIQEPRRMGPRYLINNSVFVFKFLQALPTRWWTRRRGAAASDDIPSDPVSEGTGLVTTTGTTSKTPVTVVVPCCNEEPGIPVLWENLSRLASDLADRHELEFVFVDDGSRDATFSLLSRVTAGKPRYRVVQHERNQGVAAAIMTGLRAARTEIVCSIDADCTYDPRQLKQLLPLLTDGVALVTASPYHPQGRVCQVPRWRLAISRGASFLYRCVLRQKLCTYTSCFRVYRRSTVAGIQLDNPGFVGIAELLWRLDQRGARIAECPAVLDMRRCGQSKIRLVRTIAGHLRLLYRAMWSRLQPAATGAETTNCLQEAV
jgi:exopolysaccharide biosynthesis WecB/TagA/CpsF family protein